MFLKKRADILGVVLAGGRSSRFGSNKALALFQGVSFVERTLKVMDALFDEVVVVTNTPETYQSCHHRIFQDMMPYAGPMGGLVTAFEKTSYDRLLVVACDMPLLDTQGIQGIIAQDDGDAVIPVHDGIAESLMALYHRDLLPDLKTSLSQEQRSLRKFFSGRPGVSWLPMAGKTWLNVNTREALQDLENVHATD